MYYTFLSTLVSLLTEQITSLLRM